MLYYSNPQIVFQEAPDEISLAISISGCNLQCPGCHSSFTWKKDYGRLLDVATLEKIIMPYKDYISCVIFYGGEWEIVALEKLVDVTRSLKLKTAIYTGQEVSFFAERFLSKLDYLKTGKYVSELGDITNKNSNQKMFHIHNNQLTDITHKLRRQT